MTVCGFLCIVLEEMPARDGGMEIRMVIGICEDQIEDSIRIEKACTDFFNQKNEPFEIKKFFDGQEVLDYKEKLDLLFLDIEMPEVDGIRVKNQLQKWNKNTMIVYVTVHDELMKSAFGINVFGFIQKEYLESSIKQILPSALEILQNYVMIDGQIDSRSVVYIKSEGVYCRFYMVDGSEKLIRIAIKKTEEMLTGAGYIRSHKSYLVNLRWIIKLEDRTIITSYGEVPVSGRLWSRTRKEYEKYCKKNAGYC